MKVLYVFLDSTKSLGVLKKVKSKIKLLNGDGVDAEGIFLNKYITERKFSEEECITYIPLHIKELSFFYNRRFIRNYKAYFLYNNFYKQLYKKLDEEVKRKDFDVILFRYPLANKYLLSFCKKYSNKIIFEHNSKELVELSLSENGTKSYAYINEKKFGSRVLSHAKGITGVGNEITDYEVQRSGKFDIKRAVISNSVEVDSIPIRSIPELNYKVYNLLYVTGSPSTWVGIDIVLKSISEFKDQFKQIKLFIVGPKSDDLLRLVHDLKISDKVYFEGEKHGQELDVYFNTCHAAFGTMAMQRVGLKEHSSLKILEYSSRGMPFVLGYDDTNFFENNEFKPFFLKIPYTGSSFNFMDVIDFVDKVYTQTNHPVEMRNLSERYLDTSVKMSQLKMFLKAL